jgi:hypothetical protein
LQGIYSIAGSQSNSLFYIRPTSTDILSLASSKFYGVKDFMNFFNEAAYAKTRAYVDSLESFDLVDKWFGYNKNIDSTILNPYGTKSVFDLREQFAKDLLENEESLIYYNNADFPLPYHVQPNDSKYNDAMNVDFLTIFYMLIQDVETNLWRDIDLAIANGSDTKGLPPFNA